jgi:hypothetical protein
MKHIVVLAMLVVLTSSAFAVEEGKTWATATSTRPSDGRTIVYRFIQEYQPTFDRSKYPVRVFLSWHYQSPTGMPSVAERQAMDRFEDLLVPSLESGPLASLAVVRTGNDLRRWIFYTSSEVAFRKKLAQVLKNSSSLPIEAEAQSEPGWDTYEQFVRGIRR